MIQRIQTTRRDALSLLVALLVLLALTAGCGGTGDGDVTDPGLRLYAFDCGRIYYDSPEAAGFGIPDAGTSVRELVVPCYVIEHSRGRLLWDGGLPSSVAEAGGWREMEGGWRLRLDHTLAEQLTLIDLDLSSFDFVAFSHMHFDHVGVTNELTGATLLIQRGEHAAAFAEEITVPGFWPELYEKARDMDTVFLDGEHDVFGDGRVRILPAQGHTPGHQVLFLDLPETGPILLSGDLYHFRLSRELRIVPEFNVDPTETLESMDRIETFLAENQVELWIEHDLLHFEELRKPPHFYP